MRKTTALLGVAAAGLMVMLAAGCNPDELLKVENPDELQLENLNDVKLLKVQLNGVIDQVHSTYASPVIEFANYLTDEVLTGRNWEDYARASQRIASYLEGPTNGIFTGTSRGLRMGHELAERIRVWAADDPSRNFDAELATALVFAGFSTVVMAENTCQAVISPDPNNPSGTVLSQLETFAAAVPYLTEGLTVALASPARTDLRAGRRPADVANLARVALARAYLGQGDWANAATYANQVTTTFKWWNEFVDISGGRNPLQGTANGGNFSNGIHPWFTGVHPSFNGTGFTFTNDNVIAPQTDPRIQHDPTDRTGHNALTRLYKLVQGLRYSEYTGTTQAPASASCPACTGTPFSQMRLLTGYDTDIVLADYLEAQHHYFEALAMQDIAANQAAVLAFVNSRRAVGNQAAVSLSGQALITELRNQRARDLFMGGFRLGDLRRWTRFDAGNGPFANGSYFPTGTHPNVQWGEYGSWTCFPIPLAEYEGNPNLTKPADPNVPPGI
ncbi:MAG TPA: RagB/SusD family nutrient uptake outer membrane protein [Gemmatimonadales bacterium]|nr:RagB/SusD family nutrient uptake outer membrane protein [Gemmatimonadales bacterium]